MKDTNTYDFVSKIEVSEIVDGGEQRWVKGTSYIITWASNSVWTINYFEKNVKYFIRSEETEEAEQTHQQ